MKRTDPTDSFFTVLSSEESARRKPVCIRMSVHRRRAILGDQFVPDQMEQSEEDLDDWGRSNNIHFQFDLLENVRDAYRREYDRLTVANDLDANDNIERLSRLQTQEKYWFNAFFFDSEDDAFQFKLRWWK